MSDELRMAAEIARARVEWAGTHPGPAIVQDAIDHADANALYALGMLDQQLGPAVCGISVVPEREDVQRELDAARDHLRNATNALRALKARPDVADHLRR